MEDILNILYDRLQLEENQLRTIEKWEHSSFINFCKGSGYHPKDYEKRVLENSKKNLRLFINNINNEKIRKTYMDGSEDLLTANDFWEYKKRQKDTEAKAIINHIINNYMHIHVDEQYVLGLCKELNISTPKTLDAAFLKRFLESIPVVILYTCQFNAFVEKRYVIDEKIPCVFMYDHLLVAVGLFIDFVFQKTITIDSKMALPTDFKICNQIGKQSSFQNSIKQIIDMVLGKTDQFWTDYENMFSSNPKMSLQYAALIAGATRFVWYHEYSHLLMGHLSSPKEKWRIDEFNADLNAMRLLYHHYGTDDSFQLSFWESLGMLSTIYLIVLIGKILYISESKTHPPPIERLHVLIGQMPESSAKILADYFNPVMEICNPTLERFYSFYL